MNTEHAKMAQKLIELHRDLTDVDGEVKALRRAADSIAKEMEWGTIGRAKGLQ